MSKTIIVSSDHAGFILKKKILEFKYDNELIFIDLGPFSEDSVDYPDFAHNLSKDINCGKYSSGILICGSGIGMSIVANRYENVRAALCLNHEMARLSRQHNDANVLVLGSRLISFEQAIKCLEGFFFTNFEKGRHIARINKLNNH